MPAREENTIGTISKALELLNHFSRTRPEIGLGEFVKLSGRDKATTHRHLVELAANGYLEQHPNTRAYRLGPAVLRLSGVREATNPMRTLLRPIVSSLATEVGELAHASLLQGKVLSPVFHADPRVHGTQVHFDEAALLPLHATSSGIAVLAFAPAEFRRKILSGKLDAYTPNTPIDADSLSRIVEDVRRSGLSQLDRAYDDEVASQAAPIFDASNEVIGAISVAVPTVRAGADRLRGIAGPLVEAARTATRSLGGTYPEFIRAAKDAGTIEADATTARHHEK